MGNSHLWAKSKPLGEVERPSLYLRQHLADVHRAATQLLRSTGDEQLRALGMEPNLFGGRFGRCVRLAAATHDLGKANDHFQDMICGRRDVRQHPQGLRHEWVSVLLLRDLLKHWLLPAVGGCERDFAIVEWAIGGHHPAYHRQAPPNDSGPTGAGDRVTVLLNHAEFDRCLAEVERLIELSERPGFSAPWQLPLIGAENVFAQIHRWHIEARLTYRSFTTDERRLAAAVKACLIAADVAGSAIPRLEISQSQQSDWIPEAFKKVPSQGELAEIVAKRLNGAALLPFQQNVAQATTRQVFVKAGCGTGKTLAAYHWAATNHPTRRLYFCYPTTGTATEGYRDYLYNPDAELNYRLFHGRADIDMSLIVRDDDCEPEADAMARIESLDAWSTPVVSCTVDTVLGLTQNNKRGLYAWPALAGGAFVFDEIHAYDDRLFGALLRFLCELSGVPALLMTASLPQARMAALRSALARAKLPPLEVIVGPAELENRPRYQLACKNATLADAERQVREEVTAGGRVLWVSNTVHRVLAAADSIKDLRPLVYHSRFRYIDRVQRHRDAIKAFQGSRVVVCATQVAEMSLDLSATLLVTDLAPVSALIQRLGRLNRRAAPGAPTRPFMVLAVGDQSLPYQTLELDLATQWLDSLPVGDLSQRDLADAWERHDGSHKPSGMESAWLDGGPQTSVLELRDASPGITVLLSDDAPLVRSKSKALAEVALPMLTPRRRDWRQWPTINGVPIAPVDSIAYDPLRGAEWQT